LQVEAFLHGPQQSFILTGFSGIAQARGAGTILLGRNAYFGSGSISTKTYSFTAKPDGTGRNARLVIQKTRDWYQQQVKVKEGYKQELLEVKRLLR